MGPRHEKVQAENAPAVNVRGRPIQKDTGALAHWAGKPLADNSMRPLRHRLERARQRTDRSASIRREDPAAL
jgi:hypothetical protein